MKNKTPSLQTLIQNYFLQRLMQQRNVSYQTVCSYKDTFKIFLQYIKEKYEMPVTDITIQHFDLCYLQDFCKYLAEKRNNKPVTINNRIAAIKSFIKYVSEIEPEYIAICKRALMLPLQKYENPTMDFITKDEFDSLINACDITTFIGARDKLMLMIMYNTGVRVSELLEIKTTDIHNADSANHASVSIHGKGRKYREVPLWKNTIQLINTFTKTYPSSYDDYLFKNKNNDRLTRSGVRTRINNLVTVASIKCPSLLEKNITPHTFRHSVAMNMLTSGVDISTIALWLGHSSIETTHKYMVADLENKRKAMKKAGLAGDGHLVYKPSDDIFSFLNTL